MERRLSNSSESLAAYMDEGLDDLDVLLTEATPELSSPLCHSTAELDQLLELIGGDTNVKLNIGDPGIDDTPGIPETSNQIPAISMTTLGSEIPQNSQLESAPQHVQVTASVPSKTKQHTKKKKKNYDPNKARTERRFELKCLRKQVEDLELMLKQLQIIQSKKGDFGQGGPNQLALRKNPRVGNNRPGVWEGICFRQLERRLRVERENMHLKNVYSSQMQVARNLQRLLKKRITLEDKANSQTNEAVRRVKIVHAYMDDVAARIFQELQDDVETAYLEVDTMFETNCAAYKEIPTRKPLLHNEVNGLYMGLFDSKIMPFDVRATGEAWWRRWHNYKGQRATEDACNMICEKYGLEFCDIPTNTTATLYGQQVLRRHVEDGRIVIIWSARIEPLEFNKKRVTGIHFLEKSYVLIEPYNSEGGNNSNDTRETSARISTCYIVTPTVSDPKLWSDTKTAALTKFMLATTSAYISTINETMENLLMDQRL